MTQVNEMLNQMEGIDGIFIASTNLMDGFDEASLRRFDLKVRFDFLGQDQAWDMLVKQAGVLGLPMPGAEVQRRMGLLDRLTPGDFAAVARQHRFRPHGDVADLVRSLESEVALKRQGVSRPIGFR